MGLATFSSFPLLVGLLGCLGDGAGAAAEDGARRKPGAAGVVSTEQSAQRFPAGIQPVEWLRVFGEHAAPGVRLEATEGEGDAAGHRESVERAGGDAAGPVALRRLGVGPASVLDVGVEGRAAGDRSV